MLNFILTLVFGALAGWFVGIVTRERHGTVFTIAIGIVNIIRHDQGR
jgi:uncharacterized membrane protein YeaQ/YmgE (transglycosylase-associated protein family)